MKKTIVVFVVLFLSLQFAASLQASIGVGIIVGEPTGLSIKINRFPVLGIAWSWDHYLHFHCDYWVIRSRLDKKVYGYVGIGARLKVYEEGYGPDDGVELAARVPLGLQYFINRKLEIFAELVPSMNLVPETDFDLDAGIGIRFYLK